MRTFLVMIALAALAACTQPTSTPASTQSASAAAPDPAAGVTVQAPRPNARVTSPLIATGIAPNAWYFEAVFQAKLLGADGAVIAEGPAQAQTDWTTPGPVAFRAEIPFTVSADTPATLLLREDMPSGEDHPSDRPTREIRIPVTLAAQ